MDSRLDVDSAGLATSIVPVAQLGHRHGLPEIQLSLTGELHETLSAATASGIVSIGYELRFSDGGDGWLQKHYRRSSHAVRAEAAEACKRVGFSLLDSIREAMDGELGFDRELLLGVRLTFDRKTASWSPRGAGKVLAIVDDLDGIAVRLA